MSSAVFDKAFARQTNRLGMVTTDQIDKARRLQHKRAGGGHAISLAEALLQIVAITPHQKATVLNQIKAGKTGGIRQLGQYRLLKKLGEGGDQGP